MSRSGSAGSAPGGSGSEVVLLSSPDILTDPTDDEQTESPPALTRKRPLGAALGGPQTPSIPQEHKFIINTNTGANQQLLVLQEDVSTLMSDAASSSYASNSTSTSTSTSNSTSAGTGSAGARGRTGKLTLMGRVMRRCECRPPSGAEYFRLKSAQMIARNRPTRFAQRTELVQPSLRSTPQEITRQVCFALRLSIRCSAR